MLARKGIFAKPSIPQTHLWCVEASAVKNCLAILPADIIPRSKNACSQGHFREAVNTADAPLVRGGVSREELPSNSSCGYYTTKQKCVLAQTFSRSRQCRVRAAGTVGGKAPGGCKAASDEDNLTTKQKCVLAQTFSRGRQLRRRTFGAWRRQP